MNPAPLIWINGFPGTGKCTIARHTLSLLGSEKAIFISNHQLIDPVERKIREADPTIQDVRSHSEYQERRRVKRAEVLEEYVVDGGMADKIVIFTDFQAHNELGRTVAMEYINAARRGGRPFLAVTMTCPLEENLKRLQGDERRMSGTGKLLDPGVLEAIRRRSELLSFRDGDGMGIEGIESFAIDVGGREPEEVAGVLRDYVLGGTWGRVSAGSS